MSFVNRTHWMIVALCSTLIFACVPAKKYEELKASQEKCEKENEKLKSEQQKLEDEVARLNGEVSRLIKELDQVAKDTARMGQKRRALQRNYNQLSKSYDLLTENKNRLLAENAQENKQLLEELNAAQIEIQAKEDALKAFESDLAKQEMKLTLMKNDLDKRSARVAELEELLAKKDSAVLAIKKKVQDALLGFENEGLTIEHRNGKVYVSLDESLLFASGSFTVDAKGQEVLKKLAKVLEENEDINITVEGHTDNVPYNGNGQLKDNWDLSVKRATSVVKIITENSKVDASRLTAAGRGEHIPLDQANTKEARQKNRRTEIILVPKLDELYEFINEN